jgi:hypothetical protein
VSADPVAAYKLNEERAIETTFAAVIDIFRRGLMTKLGEPETRRKLAIIPGTPFPFEQQSQPFGMGEMFGLTVGDELAEGLRHAGQDHGVQFIECWICKHCLFSLVVIAGSADVLVVDQFVRGGSFRVRCPVEVIVENGAHGTVGPGSDLQGPGASRIDPVAAEALVQADNSHAGSKALFRVRPVGEDLLAQQRNLRPHG